MGASTVVPGQSRSAASIAPLAVTGAVAAVTFLLAYDGGSFGLTSRGTLSIAVWWVLILAVAAGLWPLRNLDWTTLAVGGLLVAFAGLTLASVIWSDDPEVSFDEFNRAALYVGIFAIAALGAPAELHPALVRRIRARNRGRGGARLPQPLLPRPDRRREPAGPSARSHPSELPARLLERARNLRRPLRARSCCGSPSPRLRWSCAPSRSRRSPFWAPSST